MGSTGWGHRKLILEPNTVAVRRAKMAFFLQVKLVYVHVSKKPSNEISQHVPGNLPAASNKNALSSLVCNSNALFVTGMLFLL